MENPLSCGILLHGLGAPVGRVTLRDAWRIATLLPLRPGPLNYELLTFQRYWLS
jgi:hypothetical protein